MTRDHEAPPALFRQLPRVLFPLFLFGLVSNAGMLVLPLFMMHLFDRVVPTGSLITLWQLVGAACFALTVQMVLELQRDRAQKRIGAWVQGSLVGHFPQYLQDERRQAAISETARALREGTVSDVMNLLWSPVFVVALALIDPLFLLFWGLSSVVMALISGCAYWVAQAASGGVSPRVTTTPALSQMGVGANLAMHAAHAASQLQQRLLETEERLAALRGGARLWRGVAQIGTMALGALLVVDGRLSAGALIAASLLAARSLALVEVGVTALPKFHKAFQHWVYLRGLNWTQPASLDAPLPAGDVLVEGLVLPGYAGRPLRLDRVSFDLPRGEVLAVLGPSESGKTSLLDVLSGGAPTYRGTVRIGGMSLAPDGPQGQVSSIGYMPKLPQFYTGTIAQNIARFDPHPDAHLLEATAQRAGVHGAIRALPQGYATPLGPEQTHLGTSLLQRLSLARAFYGAPALVVLDEPNALMDAQGERQLYDAISRAKADGVSIVMSLNRVGLIGLADRVLVLDRGRTTDFGPREEVMQRLGAGDRSLRLVADPASAQDLEDWIARQFLRADDRYFSRRVSIAISELFAALCRLGHQGQMPLLQFDFTFEGDTRCMVSVMALAIGGAPPRADAIRRALTHELQSGTAMSPVMSLAQSFQIFGEDQGAKICSVTVNAVPETAIRRAS